MIAILLDCRKQQIHRGMKLLRLYWKIWMQIKLWCLRKYEWIWAWAWVWAWAHGQWHVKVDCGKDLDKTSHSKDQIKWMKWFIVCRQLVILYQQHRRNEFIIFTRVNKTENLLVSNIKWKYARTKCSLVYLSRADSTYSTISLASNVSHSESLFESVYVCIVSGYLMGNCLPMFLCIQYRRLW